LSCLELQADDDFRGLKLKSANDNVASLPQLTVKRIFRLKQGAKSGRQRVEDSFIELIDQLDMKDFVSLICVNLFAMVNDECW
jgi:hypothetical protein